MTGPRISVKSRTKEFNWLSVVFIALLVGGGFYTSSVFKTPMIWLGVGVIALSVVGFVFSIVREELIIEIDGVGIYDRDLGIGRIQWQDVENIQLLQTDESRFLSFSLKNPEFYVSRLRGAKRNTAVFHQKIGLNRFNVDVSQVDIDPLDLKRLVELHVAQKGQVE